MATSFKQLLQTNELIPVFAIARLPHSVVIDMFGFAGGYKGFWIDNEHAGISIEQIQMLAVAARANDFDSFVRIPPTGYWHVTQCLEAGAGGVMAAQIHSADHAREFLSWCKFAPDGIRGVNSSGRDAYYTHRPMTSFVEQANTENFVAIQIETLGALDDVDAIAAIKDVDLLFVGPADLSVCLGVGGQFHHEKLWTAIEQVAKACRQHGITWGCVAPDPKFATRAIENGCRMPTIGNDAMTVRRGIESFHATFDSAFTSN